MTSLLKLIFGDKKGQARIAKGDLIEQIDSMIYTWEGIKADKFSGYGTILAEARNLPPHYIERRSAGYEAVSKIIGLLKQLREAAVSLDAKELDRAASVLKGAELKRLQENFESNFRFEVASKMAGSAATTKARRKMSVEDLIEK